MLPSACRRESARGLGNTRIPRRSAFAVTVNSDQEAADKEPSDHQRPGLPHREARQTKPNAGRRDGTNRIRRDDLCRAAPHRCLRPNTGADGTFHLTPEDDRRLDGSNRQKRPQTEQKGGQHTQAQALRERRQRCPRQHGRKLDLLQDIRREQGGDRLRQNGLQQEPDPNTDCAAQHPQPNCLSQIRIDDGLRIRAQCLEDRNRLEFFSNERLNRQGHANPADEQRRQAH